MRIGIPAGVVLWGYLILICWWPILSSICVECLFQLQDLIQLASPAPPGFYPAQLELSLAPKMELAIPARWNRTMLGYQIPPNPYRSSVIKAFQIWSKHSSRFSFWETDWDSAQIRVEFLAEIPGDKMGDTQLSYLNTTKYNLIEHARIRLAMMSHGKLLSETDMINLALHEIGHALGLEHSSDPESIMYPKLQLGSQKLIYPGPAELEQLESNYRDPVLPDLQLSSVNLTREGDQVKLAIQILNSGLDTGCNFELELWSGSRLVHSTRLACLPPGNRLELGLSLGSMITRISIDPWNEIPELDEQNNQLSI